MNIKFNGSGLILILMIGLFIGGISPQIAWCQENQQVLPITAIFNEIAQHLAKRDFSSALALFDTLPAEEAQSVPIRIMRASILNSAGRTADARRIANEIIAADSRNTDAMMVLADAAAIDNRDRDRRTFLDRIIGIDPNHVRALNDLGNISLRNRNLRVAAGYFDRALAVEPDNGEALIGRAIVHRYNRELRNAERLFNRAIAVYPDWARPLHERARLYIGYDYYSDALEDLNAALLLEPDNYWMYVDRGTVLMYMNSKQEALVNFNKAITIDPDTFIAYVYSAGIKDELGDYSGAEHDYTILARLKPDYYFAHEALGIIRMRNKQWAGARDAFLEAYKQAPREFNYAILAAINWMRAGRQSDPRQFLAQVLRTAPRDSLDHAVLRLFHDLSGDADVTARIQREQNTYTKSRMLFYLASYYDIRGNKTLADRFYLMVRDLEAYASIEWRLNEMALEERGLSRRANNE